MLKLAPLFSTNLLFILAEAAGVVYPVDKVKKQGDDVLHFLGGTSPLPPLNSARVAHGTLDWVRRHQLMRTRTALHILCGAVFRDYDAKVTGVAAYFYKQLRTYARWLSRLALTLALSRRERGLPSPAKRRRRVGDEGASCVSPEL
jgi:hypothetical protein